MEMNAHIPQSYESMVELEEIAAIPHHIITPRHAKPMIGVFQDTLVGSYRLTQPGVHFSLKEYMNLMMWNKRFDGTLPKPRMGAKRYTGQQVLGALLPPINLEMGNKSFDGDKDSKQDSVNYIRIMQGDVQQGVVDGDIYMKPSKGIIHVTYNDCGAKDTVDLLDALQNTVEHFLVMNGFSVGISDLIADEKTKEDIDAMIQERKKKVEQLILQVHLDLFDNNTGKTNQQEFEDQIFGILNQATSDAGKTGQGSLSQENRLLAMVRSGSKGDPLNVAQMMACLGQTAIEGKRVPYGFTDRTLPHYKKYDDSAESRGFIESSFIRGLTPQQFFFHAMSGREGLIDTAVKSVTADTEILIQEDGQTKWTTIGAWVDGHLARADPTEVEHHETANMELLHLKNEVYIPTCSEKGVVTWGQLTAVTRHDPGECLYQVKTLGGRSVTVAKSQSLIVWDEERQGFHPKPTPEVKVGEYVPSIPEMKRDVLVTLPSCATKDEIISVEEVSVVAHPKLYDVTVPSTLNFAIANGMIVRDTADTGYIQRQLIKSMEDLIVHHDGTVRDANNNIVQYHYGEDGINPIKIETQALSIGALSEEEINKEFGMREVDWSTVLLDGIVREAEEEPIAEFVSNLLYDQRMMVEGVFQKKTLDSGKVFAPVNLARMILNVKVRFGLKPTNRTDLTPGVVLKGIERILTYTHTYHKIWAALLRFHLAPHKLIVKERFTKEAFEVLMELIVATHMKAWVQPGDQVGIVAAQSIGEPATQLTLNSVDWDTEIVIAKGGRLMTPQIGEWIDAYLEDCLQDETRKHLVQHLPNGQLYAPLPDTEDWKAASCDEDGVMKWTKLEAVTRHPVINEDGTNTILKVTLDSGRVVKATKGKSFLTLQGGKILETNGSDLKVGDELPIANSLALKMLGYTETVSLRSVLSTSEYLYGSDVVKALSIMNEADERGERHWFSHHQGVEFTVPYSRSDGFREAFQKGHNSNDIREGNVYTKRMKLDVSQIPETIPLDRPFGFFCGAYLAEGMSNQTQVIIANNDEAYLDQIRTLMASWNVGFHTVSGKKHIEKTGITGTSTSLILHSTILAKVMSTMFGRVSYEKKIPDWALQGCDVFVEGLVDGYFSGDGCVEKKCGIVTAASVSHDLLVGIQFLLARYGIYSTMASHMPKLRSFKSVSRCYTLRLPMKSSNRFAKRFTLTLQGKQARLEENHGERKEEAIPFKWDTTGDMVWDKIKAIEEIQPMKEGWVYDITVEETRNFLTKTVIAQADTFHQAGIASKSAVTRGVPRLRELLKVTQNPKATSLTIYLKPEHRDNKDKAREVVQDLELTLLRHITEKVAIYWDEKDEYTVVEEDRELLEFYRLFERGLMVDEHLEEESISKWMLRLELNREEMFNRNISIQEVVSVIKAQFGTDVHVIYSDYNSQKLVMRIRLVDNGKKTKETAEQLDEFTNLKKFQNKLLNSIVIRGLPGIKAVTFHKDSQFVERIGGKYESVEQYVLDTDGSNFIKVMNHPAVDGTRLYSTNVWDIYEVLGIEATRAVLFNEINGPFEDVGVNYRHLCLLCDVMTRSGKLMSIDRYGINKNDIGTLAKASFEETEKILLKAALFGEMDPVTGVSANIMMGQPIRGGTAFSQILLDDQALVQLLKDVDVEKAPVLEEEEAGDLSRLEESRINKMDPCATIQFQTSMVLPAPKAVMDEPEIEIEMI
jgi:DNA-directed RNA polymerase beta' subunit